jgi:hypothetical protein
MYKLRSVLPLPLKARWPTLILMPIPMITEIAQRDRIQTFAPMVNSKSEQKTQFIIPIINPKILPSMLGVTPLVNKHTRIRSIRPIPGLL